MYILLAKLKKCLFFDNLMYCKNIFYIFKTEIIDSGIIIAKTIQNKMYNSFWPQLITFSPFPRNSIKSRIS